MDNYEKLQRTLKEIFEMDKADLDFGIYRIMNQKREQVMDFIDRQLPKDIKAILGESQAGNQQQLKEQREYLGKTLDDAGIVRETSPKYQELTVQINQQDTNALEQEVFSHLANFFKRYYKDGDFISLRRYKKDVYAIPYEGEEVKLHWANHDQYYIKTSEYLKNYAFKLSNGKKVHFQLKEASTEQNNNKSQGDSEWRFAIYEELPLEVIDGELYVKFTYELYKKSVKQDDLQKEALEVISKNISSEFVNAFDKDGTPANRNRTILEKHLATFISRNTFDYFIHKDLAAFLRREVDFYIKNEVIYIDDINAESPSLFAAQLSKIKALKTIAYKIITFLAQIEEFQKRLWLKKKFVINTDYCITIDRIPPKYYAEIVANSIQVDEWKEIFDISVTSIDHLSKERFLVLDTKHFSEEFKDRLLAEFDNLDKEIDGLLLNSENFQALNLIANKYKNKADVIYFDPPYNTDATPILYKNEYRESTWLTLIHNRLSLAAEIINEDEGSFSIAIDDAEVDVLTRLLKSSLPQYEIHKVIVNHYPGSGTGRSNVSRTHEYNLFAIPLDSDTLRGNLKPEGIRERNFRRAGTGENNYRIGRPNSFYSVVVDEASYKIVGLEQPPALGKEYPIDKTAEGFIRIYPIGSDGSERVWSLSYEGAIKALESGAIYCNTNLTVNRIYHDQGARDLVQSLWTNTKYSATVHGTNLLTDLFNKSGLFSYPKSVYTIKTAIDVITFQNKDALILDYFAGSGTTGHATIKLNREDGGKRKYILVEMGSYFNTVTKPRIQKITYSDNWKNGNPMDKNGISQMFKYQVLESYEDTLNNLQLLATADNSILNFDERAQEQYMLNYMLDIETRDHLFNIEMFHNPFNYQLKFTENNELVPKKVDLVETFNYLIGLYVERMQRVKDIKLVEGNTRDGAKTLVIWRNIETTSNEETERVFRKLYDSTRTLEFQQIYINGDHHFENIRQGDDTFKVKLIEDAFFKKMFNISEL